MHRFKSRTGVSSRCLPFKLPCVLALWLLAWIHPSRVCAQTADSYRQRAVQLSRAKSWDEAISNYRRALQIEINVMLRPHARDFVYTDHEIAAILDDTRYLAQMGIDGVVFGALKADRHLDIALIKQVAEAAAPLPLTVHRALDESLEPEQALASLIGVVPRVLTAGPAPNAWEGRFELANWVRTFGDRLTFVVSGGLKLEQIDEMLRLVQAQQYHFGSAARSQGEVDANKVRELRAAIRQS